jgi:hypothetical protein
VELITRRRRRECTQVERDEGESRGGDGHRTRKAHHPPCRCASPCLDGGRRRRGLQAASARGHVHGLAHAPIRRAAPHLQALHGVPALPLTRPVSISGAVGFEEFLGVENLESSRWCRNGADNCGWFGVTGST